MENSSGTWNKISHLVMPKRLEQLTKSVETELDLNTHYSIVVSSAILIISV